MPGSRTVATRFADLVVGRAWMVVLFWIVLAIGAKTLAPSWNSVALDGDFDYLPSHRTSVAGGRLLDRAFENERSRSQMVVVLGRSDGRWTDTDRLTSLDILRRLYHRLAEVSWQRSLQVQDDSNHWGEVTVDSLNQAIELDGQFYEILGDRVPDDPPTPYEPRLAVAYWDRGHVRREVDDVVDLESESGSELEVESAEEKLAAIASDLESALVLNAELSQQVDPIDERLLQVWKGLLDVYSWEDSVIGKQLQRAKSRIAVLSLSTELTATSNIALLEELQGIVDRCLAYRRSYLLPEELGPAADLKIYVTGSAAVGGQTLTAARTAIAYTEWFTVAMILVILSVVYRAPLLVAVPLISIAIAVMVATGLVTTLASWSLGLIESSAAGAGHLAWTPDVKIYTTSRIFVVVILFGAGTDYCLFLISRLKEEAIRHDWDMACRLALSNTSGALLGSALTTIFGLGMLWFADFGKFHHTGPVIAICLSVGLFVCMTLTPACLRLIGPKIFWPTKLNPTVQASSLSLLSNQDVGSAGTARGKLFWNMIAISLTRYPIATVVGGLFLMAIPAWWGWSQEQHVTYDLTSQLTKSAGSRQGMRLLNEDFGVGQLAPVSVLVLADHDLPADEQKEVLGQLKESLYDMPGVTRVRTLNDPLGDFPPDRDMGLLSGDAWRRRALRNHRLAKTHFVSSRSDYRNRLLRLDVVISDPPFSIEAAERFQTLTGVVTRALDIGAGKESPWQVVYAGTIPSIVDLRSVTLSDTKRIKLAVIVAVLAVLILVLRRVVLSVYLIATVLLSYYATLGLTHVVFSLIDGKAFLGLDWKLPIFLFVILVAIGQDYNVYLVTRIMEERKRLGTLAAVRRAVARTGGIVTACGFVMAATFFSMPASAWWPLVAESWHAALPFWNGNVENSLVSMTTPQSTLRGITELGFALGLGVLIDTLYVRTVLVPSFVVLHDRWFQRKTVG